MLISFNEVLSMPNMFQLDSSEYINCRVIKINLDEL